MVRIGSSTSNESRTQDGHKGPDSEHFKENMSSQQSEACALETSVGGNDTNTA